MIEDRNYLSQWPSFHFPQIPKEINRCEGINRYVASLTNEEIYEFLRESFDNSLDDELEYIYPVQLTREDSFGQTMLHLSAAKGDIEITKFVIKKTGVDLFNLRTHIQQYTPLHLAVHGGSNEVIELLLNESKKNNLNDFVAAIDCHGQTALHGAVSKGNLNGCRQLYQAMSSSAIAIQMKDRLQTALHFAVQCDHYEIAELLLSKDDVIRTLLTKVDKYGQSPLHWAIDKLQDKGKKFVDLLIEKAKLLSLGESFFLIQTDQGYTALHIGVHSNCNESIDSLLKATKDTVPRFASTVDKYGQTALHWAAAKGNEKATLLLSQAMEPIDINIQSIDRQQTALHFAVQIGHLEAVRLLMHRGANPSLKNIDQLTPLDWAKKYLNIQSKEEIISILEETKSY